MTLRAITAIFDLNHEYSTHANERREWMSEYSYDAKKLCMILDIW